MKLFDELLTLAGFEVDALFWFPFVSFVLEVSYLVGIYRPPAALGKMSAAIIGIASVLFGEAPRKDFFSQSSSLGVITDNRDLHRAYDFIVIGGGISGCLIAKRLSDEDFSVLLVHGPGDTPNTISRVPILGVALYGDPNADFLYKGPVLESSHWQTKRITYNAGRQLGGAQLLSAQVWSYGKSGDYDCWQKFKIDPEKFNYENIRKFGALHERKDGGIHDVDFKYGKRGEIHISHPDEYDPFNKFINLFENEGAKITGTNVIYDHNSDELGFSRIIHAVEKDSGYVSTPTRAFFERGYKRNKLHIVTRHMAKRIMFSKTGETPRAIGVEIVDLNDGESLNVSANLKIILSAGAVRSPQLLTLSGIGPKKVLSQLNIEPVAIREGVGENLHDHYDIGSAGVCFPKGTKRFRDVSLREVVKFARTAKGQLRAPYGTRSVGFFRSQTNLTTCKNPNDKQTCRPDFELIFHQLGPNSPVVGKHFRVTGASFNLMVNDYYRMGKNKSRKSNIFTPSDFFKPEDCLYFTPTLLHPEGRGKITIKSKNIIDNPLIDLNPISNSRDMQLFGELWQTVRRISNEGFAVMGGRFNEQIFDECKHFTNQNSIEFGTCQALPLMKTAWHMSGSCRLGDDLDEMAVVNSNFNVIQAENLSLADGSLLPCPVSGHMLATTSALAEMAACNLLKEFGRLTDACRQGTF